MSLPDCQTLQLHETDGALFVTLDRPKARNAMNLSMVGELDATFAAIESRRDIRAVVLRGSDGHFCAGGDIKDMLSAAQDRAATGNADAGEGDPFYRLNRAFGHLLTRVNNAPQVVIAVLEGAVLGGGFGLACVSDVAIAGPSAEFGLPETGLGIPPAQIAPFVVARIGLTQARRLALLGARFGAAEALVLGLVHHSPSTNEALEQCLQSSLEQVQRCAPEANAITKQLMLGAAGTVPETLLDAAAAHFAAAVQGPEGSEGTRAFVEKRRPQWAVLEN